MSDEMVEDGLALLTAFRKLEDRSTRKAVIAFAEALLRTNVPTSGVSGQGKKPLWPGCP